MRTLESGDFVLIHTTKKENEIQLLLTRFGVMVGGIFL
jgi:hypothetical protein